MLMILEKISFFLVALPLGRSLFRAAPMLFWGVLLSFSGRPYAV